VSEKEDDKREKEIDKIETIGREVSEVRKKTCIPYNFGLCNKCAKFIFIEYEGYGNFNAVCQMDFRTAFSRYPSKRIITCNQFWDVTYKSVRELADMAHWLEAKSTIGFRPK
jgi:hypothetical protein